MKLILTRHGETEENKNNITQGWLPGRLTEKGKKQAKLLAERLKDIKIDIIYTSDLKRCVDTAKEIARYHPEAKFIKDPLLRELGKGEFEGKKKTEVNYWGLIGDSFTIKPKNGESIKDGWERCKKFYKMLLKKYSNETILIMAHGGSLLFIQGLILSKNLKESMSIELQKNTAISEFKMNKKGKSKIIKLNCEKHL